MDGLFGVSHGDKEYDMAYLVVYTFINSSPPSATYMRQWIGPTLVQIMACRLSSAKPLL